MTRAPRLLDRAPTVVAPGAVHLPGWLDDEDQRRLTADVHRWAASAGGFRRPRMRNGSSMSVGIACLGWHWYPYRYSRTVDDDDGRPVPPFPAALTALSRGALADASVVDPTVTEGLEEVDGYEPDVVLLNRYRPTAKMGLHADNEEPLSAPVVSISVGASAVFRFGNAERRGPPHVDVVLESGDAFVFGGPSRRCYHGVPKVLAGTDPTELALDGIRLNVTIRQSGL